MAAILKKSKLKHRTILTDADLKALLTDSTANSRYGKIKRLLAKGELLHIKRGLFCLNEKSETQPHPYELAQFIYGPSYISLESALSYHQLIPEAVHTITSVSGKRACQFNTPLGLFTYDTLPFENLYTGTELIKENNHQFLIAKPWKAICDYVYCHKKDWHDLAPLHSSLRIELDNLPVFTNEELDLYDDYYHHRRLTRFLRGIKESL